MYAYCNGNPVMLVDPSGQATVTSILIDIVTWFMTDFPDLFGQIVSFWTGVFNNAGLMSFIGILMKGAEDISNFFGNVWLFVLEIDLSGFWDFFGKLITGVGDLFAGFDLLGWLASLFGQQPHGQPYKLEDEENDTLDLQKRCFALLGGDFSRAKWDLCITEAQKKKFLTDLFFKVQGIMNTSVRWASLFSAINWVDEPLIYRGGYVGYLITPNSTENKISINLNFINTTDPDYDPYDIVKTIFHEFRHAFQQEAVLNMNNHIVCEETKDAWAKRLLDTYRGSKSPYYISTGDPSLGGEDRLGQSIEWDAKHFADQLFEYIMFALLNKREIVPEYRGYW